MTNITKKVDFVTPSVELLPTQFKEGTVMLAFINATGTELTELDIE